MEYKETESNDGDEIIDEVNDYPQLFGYITSCGLNTENELKFDGDAILAKKYAENVAASALIDLYNTQDSNIDVDNELDAKTVATSESDEVQLKTFSLPRYSPPRTQLTTFQRPHEPRIKYLLRSINLWQEFGNSGDMDKLQVLLSDILTDDCLSLNNSAIPPIVGRQKICEQRMSLNRNIPDYCVFYNNIVRSKKRVIKHLGNSFGTLLQPNANDKSTMTWNIFEYAPIEKLDEYHKIQKQKYDLLKSQNKVIKFEHRASWFLLLSRDLRRITKIMATNTKIEVF